MYKTYADFMDEISADELFEGLLGYGLFADKMPPCLSSEAYYSYCKTHNPTYDQIFVIQTYPVSWAFQPPCRTMQCALY